MLGEEGWEDGPGLSQAAPFSSQHQTRVLLVLGQGRGWGPYIHSSVGSKEQAQDLGTRGRALVPTWQELIVIQRSSRWEGMAPPPPPLLDPEGSRGLGRVSG